MKSKLFKKYKKEQAEDQVDAQTEDEDDDESAEVYSADTGVSSSKNNKMMVIFASAILITVVIYFLFFKGEGPSQVEQLEEVTNESVVGSNTPAAGSPAQSSLIAELEDEQEPDILSAPKLPDVPTLPDIPDDLSFHNTVLPSFLEIPQNEQPTANNETAPQIPVEIPVEIPVDPRRSPIIVESTGVGGLVESSFDNDRFAGGIIPLNQNAIDSLVDTTTAVTPTIIRDRTTMIIQGKMMSAVLETAINTEIPGSVRGIISRDVYAESGTNILIPKGSRLFGAFSTNIVRGQGRVEINWSRLIRPDGVDLAIGFVAADQFGRSGIAGDIDNKYGAALTNSLLTSILAIGGAIGAEKLAGGNSSTTTTSPTTGSTTTTSNASTQVISDVASTLVSTLSDVSTNAINLRPVIRVPQGTKMTIVVNSDLSIPKMKDRR
jgi:type IV secretion system protein VirB10